MTGLEVREAALAILTPAQITALYRAGLVIVSAVDWANVIHRAERAELALDARQAARRAESWPVDSSILTGGIG